MNKARILVTIAVVALFMGAVVRTVVHATDSTAQVEIVGDQKLPDTGGTPVAGSGKDSDGKVRYADALPGTKAGTYKRVYVKNTVTTMHHLPQTGDANNDTATGVGLVLLALTGAGAIIYRRQLN